MFGDTDVVEQRPFPHTGPCRWSQATSLQNPLEAHKKAASADGLHTDTRSEIVITPAMGCFSSRALQFSVTLLHLVAAG